MTFSRIHAIGLILLLAYPAESLAASPEADREASDVTSLVHKAQRAGFERHDFTSYIAAWSEDGRIVYGRSANSGNHDFSLNRKQIEATRRLRFRGAAPKDVKVNFTNVEAKVAGEKATVRYRTTIASEAGTEVVDEIFRLSRRGGGDWKITENRIWPVEVNYGEIAVKYNERTWKALDEEAAKQEKAGDLGRLAVALYEAWRFPEAHNAAKKLTDEAESEAYAWLLRANAAVLAGDADDAVTSFGKAKVLDPKASIPEYARLALEARRE